MTHQGALCGGHNVGPGGAGCRRQPIGSGRGAGRDGRSLDGYHDDLGKHIYLRSVQDRDEVLFYKLLVEQFVAAVEAELPGVLVQWEDFATAHARPILLRYRDRLLSFNDDILGTAAVAAGALVGAVHAAGSRMRDQRVVVLGAGSAAIGVADMIRALMVADGATEGEALSRFFVIDISSPSPAYTIASGGAGGTYTVTWRPPS